MEVPKAFAASGQLRLGLRACCRKPFDESRDGMKLSDDCGCERPIRRGLVECVSCTNQISGEHSCSQCQKLTCNFCLGFGENNTLCHVCKHGTHRVVQGAPGEATPADQDGIPPAVASTTGAHHLGFPQNIRQAVSKAL
jgi:hypothetical protein